MKRAVIAIPFNYDESWIGGAYYIKNLVSSFNLLPDSVRPDVWMLSHGRDSYEFIKQGSGYSRLNWKRPAFLENIDGAISRRTRILTKLAPWFLKERMDFDVIFPYPVDAKLQQTVCWIPDFQDKRLPELFAPQELADRQQQHVDYFTKYRHIVFSSHAAKKDFEHFYPEASVSKYVVPFATFELDAGEKGESVRQKYALPERYFYCPNQFWIHKNHRLVIKAVGLLKQQGKEIVVAFSGKEHDHRAPDHTQKLKDEVRALGLERNIRFLGFIPREDQMAIFREAVCVVQPSMFEGWSTVIEDAKSMSQYVLASSIDPNVEQISQNVEFFDPTNALELAGLMHKYVEVNPDRKLVDYRDCQRQFAEAFMSVVRSVMTDRKGAR